MGGNNSNEAGAGLRAIPTTNESEMEDAKKPTRTIDAVAPGKMVKKFGKARHTTNESGKVTKNKPAGHNDADASARTSAGTEGEGGSVDMGAVPMTPVTPAEHSTESPPFGE